LLYIVRVVVKMVKNKKNKDTEASEERAKEELNIQDGIDTEEEKSMTSLVVEERNAIDESVTAKVSESQKEEKK
ncbi:MAG: hypothetical protein K2O95_04200, partial [Clostridia bacterium]|nr:hypothetical protein [Clostridia bacterium]